VARAWTTQQCVNYNAALDLLEQPPAGVRIHLFQPLRPMPVGAFTISQKRIDAALASGRDEALQQIAITGPILDPLPPGGPVPK
jgi:hypothetical protein